MRLRSALRSDRGRVEDWVRGHALRQVLLVCWSGFSVGATTADYPKTFKRKEYSNASEATVRQVLLCFALGILGSLRF